ncbi:MAG: hypothetical protein Q7U80_01735 [Thiobacillus sp.]|nr:hypothetical protein [Gammaproteobacteria bacterium]MDO9006919.1 hypothetical protein [Thiobacillus sp.]
MKSSTSKSRVQGEGDYASAKKYNEHAQAFAQSGKVEQAARKAAPRNEREQDEMRQAEAAGRSHAKSQASAGKDEGSPERRQPDKQAPGKYPEGHNPHPEKIPGR